MTIIGNKLFCQEYKTTKVKYGYWKNIYQYFARFELSKNRIPILKKINYKKRVLRFQNFEILEI